MHRNKYKHRLRHMPGLQAGASKGKKEKHHVQQKPQKQQTYNGLQPNLLQKILNINNNIINF